MVRKKKEKPKTVKEIMAEIIDYGELEKKKPKDKSMLPRKMITVVKEEKPLKWFEKPMSADMFTIKKHMDRYYARHNEWGERVWIGPYEKRSDVTAIIKEYVNNSVLKPLERKEISNLHSVLIDI